MSSSPKNLRKFLDSDDIGLVRMGLSMAKGMGISDEMLMEILWMYMFHEDKTVRAAAKSTFIKLAPKDAKQAVKENWKASYRTDFISSDYYGQKSNQYGHKLGILGKALCQTSLGQIAEDDSPEFPFVQWLTKVIRTKDIDARRNAAQALETIGDVRAVESLIKALKDSTNDVRQASAKALGTFGDVRAVDPLIKLLEKPSSRESAAQALGTINDERAIEPLIMALRDKNDKFSPESAKALVQFGESARPSLIVKLEDEILSDSVAEILEKLGKSAVEPLIKVLNTGSPKARNTALETLGNIGDKGVVKPIIEVLGDKDKKLRFNAVEALGKIGNELAVKPLIATLRDKDRKVSLSAAEALVSSNWFGIYGESFDYISGLPPNTKQKLQINDEMIANHNKIESTKNEICKSIIEVFEEDWVLAGLVIWGGVPSSEIFYKFISEKLLNSDSVPLVFEDILLNHWKDVPVTRNFIRRRSGSYRVGVGVLNVCKRQTACRGSVNITSQLFPLTQAGFTQGVSIKKCKGNMAKGDLRLGVELPNPNNPQYLTTYYYCASCVSTYIDIQKRYDIMEKWWPKSLKAAQVANQRQIKEQETEQSAKQRTKKEKVTMKALGPLTYLSEIFLESSDTEMKSLGLKIKKTGFSEEMLSTFLRLYLWDDDATIRTAARSVFFSNASKTLQDIVKKNWQVRYRTMAIFDKSNTVNRVKANAIEQFIKAINSRGLSPTEYNCVEAVLYPMLKSLTDSKTAYYGSLWFSGNSGKYGLIPAISANLKLLKGEHALELERQRHQKVKDTVKALNDQNMTHYIERIKDDLMGKDLTQDVMNVASRIFAKFMRPLEWRKISGKNITLKTIELVACVAFYAACGLEGIKVTLAEISEHSKYSQAEILETHKIMKKKKKILKNDFPNYPIGWD